MITTETPTTQPSIEQPEGNHCGIFQVGASVMRYWFPEVSIDNTDTQGHLRDTDVFIRLHDKFLLPDNYIVRNVFYEHLRGIWDVFVESPDLPNCNVSSQEDFEFPRIEPVYCRDDNGAVHLVEIKVHTQRTIPVTGGTRWLLKAL